MFVCSWSSGDVSEECRICFLFSFTPTANKSGFFKAVGKTGAAVNSGEFWQMNNNNIFH